LNKLFFEIKNFKEMSRKINWFYLGIELIVVFLGISAGFFLQDYRESRTNRNLEDSYYRGMEDDIKANIEELGKDIAEDSVWLANTKYAIKQMASNTLSIDSANTLILSMLYYSRFEPQVNTYENIISSGKLNIISNLKLRQKIVAYHKKLEDYQLIEDYLQDFNFDFLMPLVMKNYDFFAKKMTNPKLRSSVHFKNIFGGYYALKQQRYEKYKELFNESKKLLEMIKI
jgi:hypothetical protein